MNQILNTRNAPNYTWGDNATVYKLCDSDLLSVKLEIIPSSESETLHYHSNATHVFFILKGKAIFQVGEQEFELQSEDSIIINPGQKHLVKNVNSDELRLLVISNPNTNKDRINVAGV